MSKPSSTNSPRLSISERKDWYISRVSRDTDIAKVTDKVALSKSNILKGIKVVIALGIHLFPFPTEKLSPTTSMVLRKSGRVDSRRFRVTDSKQMKGINRKVGSFLCLWRTPFYIWIPIPIFVPHSNIHINVANTTLQDHTKQINRVIDYINSNLNRQM